MTTEMRPPLTRRPATRRRFLQILAVGGLATGGVVLARQWPSGAPGVVRETRLLMGTPVHLAIVAPDHATARNAIALTFAEMERWVAILDHRRPESPLSQLNSIGALTEAPPELVEVVAMAIAMGHLTNGAFDVTVKPILDAYRAGQFEVEALRPLVDYRRIELRERRLRLTRPGMALTLDGLAKGRVVDAGVGALRSLGFEDVFVEAGGDLLVHGQPGANETWRVGVLSPRDRASSAPLVTIPVQQALTTSGDYQNAFTADFSLHHILDPRTLRSPTALASATTLAPTAMEADAWSTALMVLGPEAGLALVEQATGVQAMLVTKDLQMYHSSGFPTAA